MNLGQNTVETYKILKEQMEKNYQNTLFKPDYCVDRESIFKAYILLSAIGPWEPDSRYEISLGELFGIFMSIYHFWVRPVRQLKGDALSDYIGELFFSARELTRDGIDKQSTQRFGELACGKEESILKVFFWGSWILETSSNSVFQCTLKEKGVKVRFNCTNCGHEYMRDTIKIGRKMTCVECKQEIIVPSIKQRPNPPPAVKDQENPINGKLYTKEEFELMQEKRPIAIMIENSVDARPQAGLTDADIAQSLNLPQRNIEEKLRVLKYKFSSKNKPEMLVKATKIGIIPD